MQQGKLRSGCCCIQIQIQVYLSPCTGPDPAPYSPKGIFARSRSRSRYAMSRPRSSSRGILTRSRSCRILSPTCPPACTCHYRRRISVSRTPGLSSPGGSRIPHPGSQPLMTPLPLHGPGWQDAKVYQHPHLPPLPAAPCPRCHCYSHHPAPQSDWPQAPPPSPPRTPGSCLRIHKHTAWGNTAGLWLWIWSSPQPSSNVVVYHAHCHTMSHQ